MKTVSNKSIASWVDEWSPLKLVRKLIADLERDAAETPLSEPFQIKLSELREAEKELMCIQKLYERKELS